MSSTNGRQAAKNGSAGSRGGSTNEFDGKVVIITGASSGLGASMARLFASHGARLTITGRSEQALNEVANECEILLNKHRQQTMNLHSYTPNTKLVNAVVGDLVQLDMARKVINSTIATFGRLDVLINNAGGTRAYPLEAVANGGYESIEKLMDSYDYTFDLNVRAVLHLTALAIPHLEETKGNIVNISALASYLPIGDPWFTYSMSKAAMDNMTKNAAVVLGKKHIRVNSINPGPIATNLHRDFVPGLDAEKATEEFAKLREITLVNRLGQADEVASLAAHIASDKTGGFINGAIFTIDGGCGLRSPMNVH